MLLARAHAAVDEIAEHDGDTGFCLSMTSVSCMRSCSPRRWRLQVIGRPVSIVRDAVHESGLARWSRYDSQWPLWCFCGRRNILERAKQQSTDIDYASIGCDIATFGRSTGGTNYRSYAVIDYPTPLVHQMAPPFDLVLTFEQSRAIELQTDARSAAAAL